MNQNHRLTLRRSWIGNGGIVNWIMLNPSTDRTATTLRTPEDLNRVRSFYATGNTRACALLEFVQR